MLRHFVPGFQVATIGSRFHSVVAGHVVDGIPQLPPLPLLPWHQPGPGGLPFVLSLDTVQALITSAFAIAMLGAIESLLSAVVADGMGGTRHDPDAELLAQGVGNVIAPFFGGIPATGAIARTATNVRSGARSPIAAIVHSFTVLVAVLALAPLLAYVPMASLAALLLLVAWNMAELKHFVRVIQLAPKSDVMVLLTCYSLTVMFDMVLAVSVGVVLAALLFMRRMAEVTHGVISEEEHPAAKIPLPKGVIVYDIAGPLFFGAAQKSDVHLEPGELDHPLGNPAHGFRAGDRLHRPGGAGKRSRSTREEGCADDHHRTAAAASGHAEKKQSRKPPGQGLDHRRPRQRIGAGPDTCRRGSGGAARNFRMTG
jgi:SulP family sulfate permease